MVFLRFYLLILLLTVGGSLIVGMVFKDRRWFRFAWQLFKFSAVLLVVIALGFILGRAL